MSGGAGQAFANMAAEGAEFRRLSQDDIPAILEIERTSYSHPWTEGVFLDCFSDRYEVWGLEQAGQLLGYAVLLWQFEEVHLLNICVATTYRGFGLGRRLLRFVIARSLLRPCGQIVLEVRTSNQEAAQLYLSEGFEEVGRRKAYYPAPGGREDARVMVLAHPVR